MSNMQVIRSMLILQASNYRSPEVDELVRETENRIQAMALVHQKLYQSRDLSRIRLDEYLGELAELLVGSYKVSEARIGLALELSPVSVLIDTAIPCGLILNELVSNALKHAFPGGRGGEIRLRLSRREDGGIELGFADDGIGVPEGFDLRGRPTLGLQTLFSIAEGQLKGRVSVDASRGLAFSISFSDDLYAPRV